MTRTSVLGLFYTILNAKTLGVMMESPCSNVLRQLYSVERVTLLWQAQRDPYWPEAEFYNAVVYLRPDLLFHDELPLSMFQDDNGLQDSSFHVENHTIYSAPFDNEVGTALNDRFAIGSPAVMRV